MKKDEKEKVHSFSLWLLKLRNNQNPKTAVKPDNNYSVSEIEFNHKQCICFLDKGEKNTNPWWVDYWNLDFTVMQSFPKALIMYPIDDHWFAFTFGSAYSSIDVHCYEHYFAKYVMLNSIDPKKIKRAGTVKPDSAYRLSISNTSERENEVYNAIFDSEGIVNKMNGKVKDNLKELFSTVSGGSSSSLVIRGLVPPDQLDKLLKKLLELFHCNDYKNVFPGIDNWESVRDPDLEELLNSELLTEFNKKSPNISFISPDNDCISYNYLIHINGTDYPVSDYSLDSVFNTISPALPLSEIEFNQASITFSDESNQYSSQEVSLRDSISMDCTLSDEMYKDSKFFICDGEWYCAKKNYIEQVETKLLKNLLLHTGGEQQ